MIIDYCTWPMRNPGSAHLGRQESNQQSAIADRQFADILLQYPYRFFTLGGKLIRIVQKDVCKSAIGDG